MKAILRFKKHKRVFIKWFPYDKRNDAIGHAIHAECHYVHYGKSGCLITVPWRYTLQFCVTLSLLLRERPELTLVTNPPIFATLAVSVYSFFTGTCYVMDSHSDAFSCKWKYFNFLHRLLVRRAKLVIVTNDSHAHKCAEWGGKSFILSDVIVQFASEPKHAFNKAFTAAVICSFAEDEPITEILAAAYSIPSVNFYITGDFKRCRDFRLGDNEKNVFFTGFLPYEEFVALLQASDCVMSLTTRDNTMQMAAYEALSLRKPMILSNWPCLRRTYEDAAIYVDNTRDNISKAVGEMISHIERYRCAAIRIYDRRRAEWEKKAAELQDLLADFSKSEDCHAGGKGHRNNASSCPSDGTEVATFLQSR